MSDAVDSRGFVLPIIVVLLFCGALGLAYVTVMDGEHDEMRTVRDELLFWQRGLVIYSDIHGRLPLNLTFLEHYYGLDLSHGPDESYFTGISLDSRVFTLTATGLNAEIKTELLEQFSPLISMDHVGHLEVPVRTLEDWAFGRPLIARKSNAATLMTSIDMASFNLIDVSAIYGDVNAASLDASATSALREGQSNSVTSATVRAGSATVGSIDVAQLMYEIDSIAEQMGACFMSPPTC